MVDEAKEVVAERADHLGFEGHGKHCVFSSNRRTPESFEQTSDIIR